MKLLLDTCVLSATVGAEKSSIIAGFLQRYERQAVFLSVITLGEVMRGIMLLPVGQRQQSLLSWFQRLQQEYADRILPVDAETVLLWGEVSARAKLQGYQLPAMDGLIASTALQHGLHVVTRNTKDFLPSGALVINPWAM